MTREKRNTRRWIRNKTGLPDTGERKTKQKWYRTHGEQVSREMVKGFDRLTSHENNMKNRGGPAQS